MAEPAQLFIKFNAIKTLPHIVTKLPALMNDGDDSYLTGILNDFGIIVEEQVEPDIFFKICENLDNKPRPDSCERAYFQTDHSEFQNPSGMTSYTVSLKNGSLIKRQHK